MNRIGVLKDVAYAAKAGGGTIANMGEVGLLAAGAWAIFNPSTGAMLAGDTLNADAVLSDAKDVVFGFGRADSNLVVTVPRKLNDLNRVNSRAFTKPVITVGGIDAASSLSFDNEGEATVKIYNTTHSSRFSIPSIRASVYKTASMTTEELVDKVVAKLNASSEPFGVTATKVKDGGSAYFGITITPNDEDLQIEAALDGMWANDKIEQTTDPVYGIGAGKDVLQMEKDFSTEEGNGNYIEYGADHWKGSFEADASARYDQITLVYDAYHSGPVNKRHVSTNRLIISAVNGAATMTAAAVIAILDDVFPTYASATTGQETAEDTGGANDGV